MSNQKKTKKNEKMNKWFIIGAVVILVLILIVVIILTVKLNRKPNAENKPSTSTIPNVENTYNYKCEKENLLEDSLYKEVYINYIKVDNERVLNSINSIKVVYENEDDYKEAKEYEQREVKFNDNEKSIEYFNEESKTDYTKDESGKEVKIDYENYKTALKRENYTCDKIDN